MDTCEVRRRQKQNEKILLVWEINLPSSDFHHRSKIRCTYLLRSFFSLSQFLCHWEKFFLAPSNIICMWNWEILLQTIGHNHVNRHKLALTFHVFSHIRKHYINAHWHACWWYSPKVGMSEFDIWIINKIQHRSVGFLQLPKSLLSMIYRKAFSTVIISADHGTVGAAVVAVNK